MKTSTRSPRSPNSKRRLVKTSKACWRQPAFSRTSSTPFSGSSGRWEDCSPADQTRRLIAERVRAFDLAAGDIQHHGGHHVMAHDHAEFDDQVIIELASQRLVGRRREILDLEKFVGGG